MTIVRPSVRPSVVTPSNQDGQTQWEMEMGGWMDGGKEGRTHEPMGGWGVGKDLLDGSRERVKEDWRREGRKKLEWGWGYNK